MRTTVPGIVCILVVAILPPGSAIAGQKEKEEPAKLAELRTSWNLAKERGERPIKKSYLNALVKLRDDFTKSGDLSDAILVRTEIESLTEVDAKALVPIKPPELVALRKTYDDAMAKLRGGLDQKYVKALRAMQSHYKRKPDLEGALAVAAELAKFERKRWAMVSEKGLKFGIFKEGEHAFSDDMHQWTKIPDRFKDYRVSMAKIGKRETLRLNVKTGGLLLIVAEKNDLEPLQDDGWAVVAEAARYGKPDETPCILTKEVRSGRLIINTKSWLGVRLLLPAAPERR